MNEIFGVAVAVLSSALGGLSVGATRYLALALDPLAIGAVRFGIGVVVLLPAAVIANGRWPARADWAACAGLGLLFFALFPILFNASLIFTTAARGALALSTLPLLTLAVAASLGVEPLTPRKASGVLIATGGVAVSLVSGLGQAPAGAWRGDLLMVAAAMCMTLYSIFSRPLIQRSGPLTFTCMAMGVGALSLALLAWCHGSLMRLPERPAGDWKALLFLGLVGGAATFLLWSMALRYTTPTRVAMSVTVNPISASLVGATGLGEPIRWTLIAGVAAVLCGIVVALPVTRARSRAR